MASVTLYIAMSIDGFIADEEGGISWLDAVDESGEDYGYGHFYDEVDVLVMGRATYEQILEFGQWPYEGKPTYVFSSKPKPSPREDVAFISKSPEDLIEQIEQDDSIQRVWLVGGGKLNASFLQAGLVDELIISVIPVVLGNGIRLFQGEPDAISEFALRSTTSFRSGLVQLHYNAVTETDEQE